MAPSTTKGPKAPRGDINSSVALPMTTNGITAKWLSEALGVEVKDAVISSVIQGTSSKVFVDLTYPEDKQHDIPARLCVKGGFNPQVRELFPEMWATYRREAEFYWHVAPLTSMVLPKTWYCGTDTANGQGLFIMSDMADCKFGNPLEPWTADVVRGGVRQLASLHGKTWGTREADHPWLAAAGGANPMRGVVEALFRPEPWAARFAEHRRPPVAAALLDRGRVLAAYRTLWRATDARSALNCIVHGDDHVGNTFVSGPSGGPGFIDWQCVHHGSPIHDLAYFVAGAMTVEDRRAHEAGLVQDYLDALRAEGGPELAWEQVWEAYRMHSLHGFLWALTPLNMQPDDVVFAITERYSAAIVDHKSLELLESLPEHKQ